ncbi:MAG: phosphohistidine phosphatase SixA [Cyanobacteria bacterium]|nr:phosphohistidine phosphatase SixA [Cyanobacteriota bacterium]
MAGTRELLLLRHGIAEERRLDLADGRRVLTPEGRQRTDAVLQRLVALGLGCDLLLSSPLTRARQTAELARLAGLAPDLELATGLVPEGDSWSLLQLWLADTSPRPGWRRLALVGHEPDLGLLAARLIGAPAGAVTLKKAGVALVALAQDGGEARLKLLLSPRSLLAGR